VFCLLLIGCASETSYLPVSETPTSAIVYAIPYEPEIAISLGRIIYPIHREGLEVILENIGQVGVQVQLRITTSNPRSDSDIFCRRTDDAFIPKLRPGQRFHHTFYLERCSFPRDDNLNHGAMKITIEVLETKTGRVLASLVEVMQDSKRKDRNARY